MPYSPTTWVDNSTLVSASLMNKIESGIVSLSAPAPSATPPASPADGDLWYLPADAANGVVWQFRYNAGSASAYKWEFVGGGAIASYVQAEEGTTNTGFVPLATPGPSLLLPRAGDYRVEMGNFSYTSAGNAGQMGAFLNGVSTGVTTLCGATFYTHVYRSFAVLGVTAGWGLACLYKIVGTGTANFGDRTLLVRPIRVS